MRDLIDADKIKDMEPHALVLYLLLREEPGASKDFLVNTSGYMDTTIHRNLVRLKNAGWIEESDDGFYPCDVTGFIRERKPKDSEKNEKLSAFHERLKEEEKEHLSRGVRSEIKKTDRKKVNGRHVLEFFLTKYEEYYGEKFAVNKQKMYSQCKRLLQWSADDFDHVKAVIEYAFEHWDLLKEKYKLNENRPTVGTVSTGWIWNKIRDAYYNGLDKTSSIKDRADSEGPEKGWDDD